MLSIGGWRSIDNINQMLELHLATIGKVCSCDHVIHNVGGLCSALQALSYNIIAQHFAKNNDK